MAVSVLSQVEDFPVGFYHEGNGKLSILNETKPETTHEVAIDLLPSCNDPIIEFYSVWI